MPVSLDAVKIVPEEDARNGKAAVIEVKGSDVALVALNPELPATKKVIHDLEARRFAVKVFVVSPSSLNAAFHFYKFIKPESEEDHGQGDDFKESTRSIKGEVDNPRGDQKRI